MSIWTEYASAYDKVAPVTSFYAQYLDSISRMVGQDKTVIDLGVGTGHLAYRLAKQGNIVYGVDTNDSMLHLAHGKSIDNLSDRLFVSKQDVQSLGFRDGFFDAAVSVNVLYCLANPSRFLQEVYRILKEDGEFFLSSVRPGCDLERLFDQTSKDLIAQGLYQEYRPYLDVIVECNRSIARAGLIMNVYDEREIAELLSRIGYDLISCEDMFLSQNFLIRCRK